MMSYIHAAFSVDTDKYPSLAVFGLTFHGDIWAKSQSSLVEATTANGCKLVSLIPLVSTVAALIFASSLGFKNAYNELKGFFKGEDSFERYAEIRATMALASVGIFLLPVDLFFTCVYRPYVIVKESLEGRAEQFRKIQN